MESPDAASASETPATAATRAENARYWDLLMSLSRKGLAGEERERVLAELSAAIPFRSLERIADIAAASAEYKESVEELGLTGLVTVYGKVTRPSWQCNLCGQHFPDRSLEDAAAHLSTAPADLIVEGVERCAALGGDPKTPAMP